MRGRSHEPPSREDAELAQFFTDADTARNLFDQLLSSGAPPKPLLLVHGTRPVGKSSLLRMYRLACRKNKTPVALVPVDEIRSSVALVELVRRLVDDLRESKIDCLRTEATLDRYSKLNAKAEGPAKAQKGGGVKIAADLAKVAIHTVGGEAAERLSDKGIDTVFNVAEALRNGLLSSAEAEFVRDPSRYLREELIKDLRSVSDRGLIVLMIDAYERVGALDAWMGEFSMELPAHVLLVLAGRSMPTWDRAWPGWQGRAVSIELVELGADHLRQLVRSYYAVTNPNRGEPDPKQVESIVAISAGIPLAATIAVKLWVQYNLTDLGQARPQVALAVADWLLEGVPAADRPHFEAAAVLRYFNVDSLEAVLAKGSHAQEVYDKLRRWPFIRPHRNGLSVHDWVRDVICDSMRASSDQHFQDLNTHAAEYYAQRVKTTSGEEAERASLELLYHRMRYKEAAAMIDFQARAEELVRPRLVARLRSLLNDVNRYPLQERNSLLWRDYYNARLAHLEGRAAEAEAAYVALGATSDAEPKLRAYALCDLGGILDDFGRQTEPGGQERALKVIQDSLSLTTLDSKLLTNYASLTNLSNARSAWDESLGYLEALREQLDARKDIHGLVATHNDISAVHALRGNWADYLRERAICMDLLKQLPEAAAVRMTVLYFNWPLTLMGRYTEAEACGTEALELAIRVDEQEDRIAVLESLALALGLQRRDALANTRFDEALAFPAPGGQAADRYIRATLSFKGLVELRRGALDQARADLTRALAIKLRIGDIIGVPEVYTWLGQVSLRAGELQDAQTQFAECLKLRERDRRYFECAALIGLAQTNRMLGNEVRSDDLSHARELATRYEYHDLLAALSLETGHTSLSSLEYRRALVSGLRYNRFLLDDVLSGPDGIVPHCVARGAVGKGTLQELRDWWTSGRVDVAEHGPGAFVSQVLDGESLMEAERKARQREPGNGMPQRSVIQQIDAALA